MLPEESLIYSMSWALSLIALKDFEPAKSVLEAALSKTESQSANRAALHSTLGDVYFQLREFEKSAAATIRAISLYEQLGEHQEAVRVANSASKTLKDLTRENEAQRVLRAAEMSFDKIRQLNEKKSLKPAG